MNERLKVIPDTLIPWSASGPGWANKGITFRVRGPDGKEVSITKYAKDFKLQSSLLALRIAVECVGVLQTEAELDYREKQVKR